jgi:hypothetical protein
VTNLFRLIPYPQDRELAVQAVHAYAEAHATVARLETLKEVKNL